MGFYKIRIMLDNDSSLSGKIDYDSASKLSEAMKAKDMSKVNEYLALADFGNDISVDIENVVGLEIII